MHSLCPSYPVQTNPNFPDNFNFTFSLTLAWLFKVGIERAEEAVNNSVGEAAGEFFQNIGEVPVFQFLRVLCSFIRCCCISCTNICLGGASTGAHQFPWRLLVQTENHGEHNQLTHYFYSENPFQNICWLFSSMLRKLTKQALLRIDHWGQGRQRYCHPF